MPVEMQMLCPQADGLSVECLQLVDVLDVGRLVQLNRSPAAEGAEDGLRFRWSQAGFAMLMMSVIGSCDGVILDLQGVNLRSIAQVGVGGV